MIPEGVERPLRIWLGSRLGVAVLSAVALWVVLGSPPGSVGDWVHAWNRWDAPLFAKVAQHGYLPGGRDPDLVVFFPGMPTALRLMHLVVRDWVLAGLLVSFAASGVASWALWQLAADEWGPEAGDRAVLFLVLSPYAVFLFAGYSEALFLAFAATAWLFARRERWAAASLLASGAVLVRVTGLALAVALVVQYAVTVRRSGGRPELWRQPGLRWLSLPAVTFGCWTAYLRYRTGHWDAYTRALARAWGRGTVSPLDAWRTTWRQATARVGQGPEYLWSWRAEVAAVVLGVVLVVVLLALRRWGEATFVGLNVAMLSVSSYYASGVRATIVWFPLWLLLARMTGRHRWLREGLLWSSGALMAAFVVAFTGGRWVA